MDFLIDLAALPPDDGLGPEGNLDSGDDSWSGLLVLAVLGHILGLVGYFAFPLVCLRLFRGYVKSRPGWKTTAAAAVAGLSLAVLCEIAVGLLLFFFMEPVQFQDMEHTMLLFFSAGQMAGTRLGPLLLSFPVFWALRKLPRAETLTALATGFGRAYLLLFLIPHAVFMLFKDYAGLLVNPEFPLRPASVDMVFGLAAVPVFFLLLRSLLRRAKTLPAPWRDTGIAAYMAIAFFPIPAWIIKSLSYAAQEMADQRPDTVFQSLAYYSLPFADPLWLPLLTALAAAGALKLCARRVISGTQAMLAGRIVFLCAASVYIITACILFFSGHLPQP